MKRNLEETEYEIHFAAQAPIPLGLAEDLRRMEFREDGLIGQGVVFSPGDPNGKVSCPLTALHVSWDTLDRDLYLRQRDEFAETLAKYDGSCIGYVHGEVIKPEWDLSCEYKPFDDTVSKPAAPFSSEQRTEPKKWDIHISAVLDHLDHDLQSVLFDQLRMYYIDIRKPTGLVKRVFTIQGSSSIESGKRLFSALVDYVARAGGMAGSIKFEQTCHWATYGHPKIVPPLISRFELSS